MSVDARPTRLGRTATRPVHPVAVVAAALIAVWFTIDVLRSGWMVSLDSSVSALMRDTGIRDSTLPKWGVYALTQFGARGTILALLVPFAVGMAWRRRTVQPLIRFAAALALLTVTVFAFKFAVGRTAPPVDHLHANGASFPSGHAPNAVLMWGTAAWLATEYRLPALARRWLAALRYVAPATTAVSMLLLDYHWLTDLVAGLAVGVVLLWILKVVFDGPLGKIGDTENTWRILENARAAPTGGTTAGQRGESGRPLGPPPLDQGLGADGSGGVARYADRPGVKRPG